MSFTPPKTTDKIKDYTNDLLVKLAKFYHRRNIDTDIENYGDITVRTGWVAWQGTGAPATYMPIDYGIIYDEEPLVFAFKIGTKLASSGEPENIGDFPNPTGKWNVGVKGITTSGFDMTILAEEGGWLTSDYWFGFLWVAIGKKKWASTATEELNILNFIDAGLPKIAKFYHRQNKTTNIENYGDIVIRSGWTYKIGNDTNNLVWEEIDYGITYDEEPLVFLSSGMKRLVSAGAPTKLSDMEDPTEYPEGKYPYDIQAINFNAKLRVEHDTYLSTYYYGLIWIAIGKKT